jgi:Uma2 family endonuclease
MSTVDRIEVRTLPPLVAGQRLDQPTFHERYEAMPPGTRAELIGGIVYMPSPVSRRHGQRALPAAYWLLRYEEFTPGVEALDNVTTILGPRGEPQPDVSLRILQSHGGQTGEAGGFLAGAPELIVEVAISTRKYDLGPKLRDYQAAGVREYIVTTAKPDDVIWHVLRDGRLVRKPVDPDGVYRSEVFPGLWLDPAALLSRNLRGLTATLMQGLATPEHSAFVARLAEAARKNERA